MQLRVGLYGLTATQRGLPQKDDHRDVLAPAGPDAERETAIDASTQFPRSPPEFVACIITPAWKFLTLSPSVSEDPHNINTSPDIRFPIRDRFGTTDPVSVAR